MQKFLRLGNSHRFFLIFILFRTDFLFDRNYTMDRSRKKEFSSIFSYFHLISNRISFRWKLHDGSFEERRILLDFFLFFILFQNKCQIPSIRAIEKFSSIFSYFYFIFTLFEPIFFSIEITRWIVRRKRNSH